VRVSIIINNYNYERYIGCAVESALSQTYADTETIVVDDGSSDGSVPLLQRIPGIRVIEKSNGGQGSAYNTGFRDATGSIVLFLDADDWLYPSAVEEVVEHWKPGTAKVQFRLQLSDDGGRDLGRYVPRSMHDSTAKALVLKFGAYGSPPASGNAYAAEFLRRILPMQEPPWRRAADTVPILMAPLFGEVISLPRVLGGYRLHRRLGSDELLLNNAPADLWEEFGRIVTSKQLMEAAAAGFGFRVRSPLLLAPWECRIVTLCLRFGGPPPPEAQSRIRLLGRTLGSLWAWPDWTIARKILLTGWMMLVLALPQRWSRRLATLNRSQSGGTD